MKRSIYAEKVLRGVAPDDEDWTDHLRRAHAAVAGMTPPVFGAHRTKEGLNSYQVLAKTLDSCRGPIRVLDLGCGDGFLLRYLLPKLDRGSEVIGVDMVDSEIETARKTHQDPRVRFLCETAQD